MWRNAVAAACAFVAVLVVGITPASALVVRATNGHSFGIAPHRGIAPASVRGSIAAQRAGSSTSNSTSNQNLTYHGGPIVHSSTPYLIFWTPSGFSIPTRSEALIQRYVSDVSLDSGKPSNVYALARQYTDGTGFADYQQTWSASRQVITDTQAYPAFDQSNCDQLIGQESACVSDAQIEAELQRLVSGGLPDDGPASSSSLPANAPVYYVVLPANVNTCDVSGSCADNVFCSYHSSFPDTAGHNVLYAVIPYLAAAEFPKGCQADGTSQVQEPNGDLSDVAMKFLSHESNETLTDPLLNAWFNGFSGNEDGDNCNATGASNPRAGTDPNAFLPVLGGSASAGTLYDQLISGDPYYLQSEWSNGDSACEMATTPGAISPSFTLPAGPNPAGNPVTFDPTSSSSAHGYSSVSWSFGDGKTSFTPAPSSPTSVSHTYTAAGNYTVTLTLVDDLGNLATSTRSITIGLPPSPAFSFSPQSPLENTAVSFDASSSSDPDAGVSLSSYAWDFGDGSKATTTVPTTSHTYAHFASYTVKLTVTNSIGLSSTVSHVVTVGDELPTAAFASQVQSPTVGQAIPFDGTSSSDPDGSITSYAWDFGDGTSIVSGSRPTHSYTTAGTYTVTLTVTDSDGQTNRTSQDLTVIAGPIASFTFNPSQPLEKTQVSFDGTSSRDPESGATITNYKWDFGDGSSASGAQTTHVYATYGTYTAKLTVTNSNGVKDTAPETVVVSEHPPTAIFSFSSQTPVPAAGQPVSFNGSASSDPDGPIVSYSWDFGDGATATGAAPSHTYTTVGTYTATLTVTDGDGQSVSTTEQVAVHALPQAAFSYSPPKPGAGTMIGFDATGSSDSESGVTITSYAWNFGDGTTIPPGPQVQPSHAYATPGDYLVTLTVTNSLGLTSTNTHRVVVLVGPTAAFSIQTSHPTAGEPVAFDGSGSSDPDTTIVSYAWTFGDGQAGAGVNPSHVYASIGSYTVTLTVTDGNGLTNTVSQQVSVHAAPLAAFSFAPTLPVEDTAVGFDASTSSDPEPGVSITSYSWNFGDGTSASGPSTSHVYDRPGTFMVTLTLTTSAGTTSSTSQSVTVSDQPPTAVLLVRTAHPVTGEPVLFESTGSSDPDEAIGSYSWSFGDGHSATGASASHQYRRPGSFRVTLTVTDALGESATVYQYIRVAPARITRVSLRSVPGGAALLVAVNAAGVVFAGRDSIRIRHPGTVRVRIELDAAQTERLSRHQSVKVPVKIHYVPHAGASSRKSLTITFVPASGAGRHVNAKLQR